MICVLQLRSQLRRKWLGLLQVGGRRDAKRANSRGITGQIGLRLKFRRSHSGVNATARDRAGALPGRDEIIEMSREVIVGYPLYNRGKKGTNHLLKHGNRLC